MIECPRCHMLTCEIIEDDGMSRIYHCQPAEYVSWRYWTEVHPNGSRSFGETFREIHK